MLGKNQRSLRPQMGHVQLANYSITEQQYRLEYTVQWQDREQALVSS